MTQRNYEKYNLKTIKKIVFFSFKWTILINFWSTGDVNLYHTLLPRLPTSHVGGESVLPLTVEPVWNDGTAMSMASMHSSLTANDNNDCNFRKNLMCA